MATTSALSKLKTRASAADSGDSRELQVPLDKIVFDPDQPRKEFTESKLQEMADSLGVHGQIQAIVVQDNGDDTYTLIVGERRTRGALLRGQPTIRAKVRNDLTNRSKRLLFQLTENVQREELTERDLASSILELMRDIPGVQTPMSQRDIASSMGKSEGWVSRYVKFADQALQDKWVRTGILDTVEKVYRVSLLSEQLQGEIVRRVGLPEGDDERLAMPLTRAVIEEFARNAKISKIAASVAAEEPAAPDTAIPLTSPEIDQSEDEADVGAALANSIKEAFTPSTPTRVTGPAAAASGDRPALVAAGGYQLPAKAREKIITSEPASASKSEKPIELPFDVPVHCQVEAASIVALMGLLEKSSKDVRNAASKLKCNFVIPGPLAQVIANAMTNKKVAPSEAGDILKRELAKLR